MPRTPIPPPPGSDPDGIVLHFRVAAEHAGQRLDKYLQSRIPRLSRTKANQIVRNCGFTEEGRRRKPSERVRPGERVIIVRPRFEEPRTPQNFGVWFEDEALMIVEKPSGLPMHPTATYHRNTLTYMMREQFGDGGAHICHRLDKETSGIVVCGKGRNESTLKIAFEKRKVKKEYLAVCQGELPDDGVIESRMARVTEGLHILMELNPDGLEARTEFNVLERKAGWSLVHLFPHTGRQHQLRVHLASLGAPIVGDKLYGPEGTVIFTDFIANDMEMYDALAARAGHRRQALHAHAIHFAHPGTGASTTFRSPLPSDLQQLWDARPMHRRC